MFFQDIGGRREQQDRVAAFWDDAFALIVLADGLAGHIDGALAAVSVTQEVSNADASADAADTCTGQ